MNKYGVEVAELCETASFLLCRVHLLVCNGLDFPGRNGNSTNRHSIAKNLHLLKAEETLFKAELPALLLKML
jgi:hypothetical protein